MSNAKDIRKQVRNVIQELIPELLTKEVVDAITKQMHERVTKLENDTKAQMKEMNERHKDVMGYLVRQASSPAQK
jgi:hypothetical protein